MVGKEWKPPKKLNGHIWDYGRTDSGKTWKMLTVLQFYHAQGYKIWDLWGGKRQEGGFWCFPSEEKKLWFEYQQHVGEMSSPGPKKYKINFLFPLFLNNIPDKIFEKKPRISAIPFTLYFKNIGVDEISTVTGGLSRGAITIWKKVLKELPDNANSFDILKWFEKGDNKQYKRTTLYNSFIEPFCNQRILMGKNFKYNLNIIEEAENRGVVSILMDDFTPNEFKMFFQLYILRNIRILGDKDVISRKNIAYFRELNYFMKVLDSSAQDAEQKQIMRNHFSEIVRYGRSSILIAGDTQSPNEVKGIVEGQEDLLLISELPGDKDREVACDRLVRDGKMSSHQRDYLGSVNMTQDEKNRKNFKGKMVVVPRGGFAILIKRVQPPRTMAFKNESFKKVWKKRYNEWKDMREIKQRIKDDYFLKKETFKEDLSKKKEIPDEKMQNNLTIKNIESNQSKNISKEERLKRLKRENLEKELAGGMVI